MKRVLVPGTGQYVTRSERQLVCGTGRHVVERQRVLVPGTGRWAAREVRVQVPGTGRFIERRVFEPDPQPVLPASLRGTGEGLLRAGLVPAQARVLALREAEREARSRLRSRAMALSLGSETLGDRLARDAELARLFERQLDRAVEVDAVLEHGAVPPRARVTLELDLRPLGARLLD